MIPTVSFFFIFQIRGLKSSDCYVNPTTPLILCIIGLYFIIGYNGLLRGLTYHYIHVIHKFFLVHVLLPIYQK